MAKKKEDLTPYRIFVSEAAADRPKTRKQLESALIDLESKFRKTEGDITSVTYSLHTLVSSDGKLTAKYDDIAKKAETISALVDKAKATITAIADTKKAMAATQE